MDCNLAMKENEILPFVTLMDLEGIMLSETSQTKTNTIWFHLQEESNKTKTQTHRYRGEIGERERVGRAWNGKKDQEVHTFSYKINKSWGWKECRKENKGNDRALTLYGNRWKLDLPWSSHNVHKCWITIYWTCETNTILYELHLKSILKY